MREGACAGSVLLCDVVVMVVPHRDNAHSLDGPDTEEYSLRPPRCSRMCISSVLIATAPAHMQAWTDRRGALSHFHQCFGASRGLADAGGVWSHLAHVAHRSIVYGVLCRRALGDAVKLFASKHAMQGWAMYRHVWSITPFAGYLL
jgi:uncharacterized protein YfiM (DUF2279 family)